MSGKIHISLNSKPPACTVMETLKKSTIIMESQFSAKTRV